MQLTGLLDNLRRQESYQSLLQKLETPGPAVNSLGLNRSARPYVVAALATDSGRPTIVVTARSESTYNLAEQLVAWNPALRVLTYAEPGPRLYERGPWGPEASRARLQTLTALDGLHFAERPANTVLVASARALIQRTIPRHTLHEHTMILRRSTQIPAASPDQLLHQWLRIGYEHASVVVQPGTFSRRGGIIDVFPEEAPYPVRIELWGDDIDSIRQFDPATQRSLDEVREVRVSPALEALPEYGPHVAQQIRDWVEAYQASEHADPALNPLEDLRRLDEGTPFAGLPFYLPYMHAEAASLLDYLPDDSLVLIDDWDELEGALAELEYQALEFRDTQEKLHAIPPNMPLPLITWGQLEDDLRHFNAAELGGGVGFQQALGIDFTGGDRFAGQLKLFLEALHKEVRAGTDHLVVVSRQASRLVELWIDYYSHPQPQLIEQLGRPPQPGQPVFVNGALAEGWVLTNGTSATRLYTDAEVFGWKRPEPRRRSRLKAATPEATFADLKPGDFVVHSEYGIGRFQGLEKRELKGIEREFLLLTYLGGDILYVPIHQADRITRYVGADDTEPALTRLGTQEWIKARTRTQQAVEELAADLLELYAQRESVRGYAFTEDTPWQHELEASFPYVETEDQLQALHEVKQDMEQIKPMDRLICGDVGYGKTEVALRAAFKAVMDGKQVAILVPTTVLAQQHFETFSSRVAAFPVKVEMLSRFRNRSEQEAIIEALEKGGVDIVIGTHRILGSDVKFQDLGLLIIDEEQRFGVTHKERMKQMRTEVDVLTLTATPIPRTLYMSMTGIRDISVINTPPEERLAVATHVGRKDKELVRQSIMRELERGGQVFYVHNRVNTIYAELERLEALIPEAKFAVGHGQMSETQLEAVMTQFAEGGIDVLLTTTIIEAGLDIPNANTLIVDRADRFGLSQLHQLRGRVGRGANRAYAYFFHPGYGKLTPEARARLDTIGEETDLGAGMNIAMRDLEIRGAGDILGGRQHGHISTVGFHLYTRMLAQAVQTLREGRDSGEAMPELDTDLSELAQRGAVTIDLPMPTYIPTDFIPDLALRVNLYRRMADMHTEQNIGELQAELEDRFGMLPPPVEGLLFQLRVKVLAHDAGVDSITTEGSQMNIHVPGLAYADRQALQTRIGFGVRVSRVGIWLSQDEGWESNLVEVLKRIGLERQGELAAHG